MLITECGTADRVLAETNDDKNGLTNGKITTKTKEFTNGYQAVSVKEHLK